MDPRRIGTYTVYSSARRTRRLPGILAGGVAIVAGVALLFVALWLALFFVAVGAIALLAVSLRSWVRRRAVPNAPRRHDVIDIVVDEDDIRVEPYDRQ